MSGRRPRLLVVGDAIAPTGFARVIHSVLAPLSGAYEIQQLGCNYWGDPHTWPWPIFPAGRGPQSDWTGRDRLPSLVASFAPDLIFLANDLEVVAHQLSGLDAAHGIPIVASCPVNAGPVNSLLLPRLAPIDHLVLYTEFARRTFATACREAPRELTEPLDAMRVSVLPHGVDSETFFPLCEDPEAARHLARQRLYGAAGPSGDALIVLNANRNRPHKRIDVTLSGFAESVAGRDEDIYLHLHMGSQELGWDVRRLARRLGIEERLILTTTAAGHPDVSNERLNLIYNAADIGINTSCAEGWGLISFEHGATGAAQVVPRHTGVEELWCGSAELLEPRLRLIDPQTGLHQHIVAVDTVADSLRRLYEDPAHRQRLAKLARANATQASYRWPSIAARWQHIFDRISSTAGSLGGSPHEAIAQATHV